MKGNSIRRRGNQARRLLESAALAVSSLAGASCDAVNGSVTISNPKGSWYDGAVHDAGSDGGGRGGSGGSGGGFVTSNPKGSLYDAGFDASDSPDAGDDDAGAGK